MRSLGNNAMLEGVSQLEQKQKVIVIEVTEREKVLLDYLRQTEYGDITVTMRNGQPRRILEVKRSIDLEKAQ